MGKQRFSRRNFLKTTGAAIATAAFPGSMVRALAAESEPVDVMIIGSGFGGAVTALRLVEQGMRVVMLERGRRWTVTSEQNTFSTMTNPDGRAGWLAESTFLGVPTPIDKYIGMLELIVGNGIAVFCGAGVGGSSLAYAGVTYQPPQFLFDQVFGQTVDYHEMASIYYPRAKAMIGASPIPNNLLQRPEYAAAKTLQKLGQRAGLTTKLIDVAVDWNMVADEINGTLVPSVIAGEFWYGNNSGAKLSVDKSYLKRAEASGRLDILTQHQVTTISQGPDGRYIVVANEIDTNGSVLTERKYVVKKLFLSAGSMGTSKLLVRSKALGGLPALNSEVGRNWGSNGDFFSTIVGLPPEVSSVECGPAPIAIEDFNNPIAPTSVECFSDYFDKDTPGTIGSIGMINGPAKGTFVYDPNINDVVLNWPSQDPDVLKITQAADLTYKKLTDAWDGAGKLTFDKVRHGMQVVHHRKGVDPEPTAVSGGGTSHPCGGVVLNLATDNIGAVKNYNGLYVVDGALVPGNTGCANPSLTITALAERNIERIIDRDFR